MATGRSLSVTDPVRCPISALDAEAGSARVELGVPVDGVSRSRIAGLVFAGIDFGDTAGEEAAEALASGADVMYDLSCVERVRYFAMLR